MLMKCLNACMLGSRWELIVLVESFRIPGIPVRTPNVYQYELLLGLLLELRYQRTTSGRVPANQWHAQLGHPSCVYVKATSQLGCCARVHAQLHTPVYHIMCVWRHSRACKPLNTACKRLKLWPATLAPHCPSHAFCEPSGGRFATESEFVLTIQFPSSIQEAVTPGAYCSNERAQLQPHVSSLPRVRERFPLRHDWANSYL